MKTKALLHEKKGPKGYRVLVIALHAILGLLFYWLLGFVMEDISTQPHPSLANIQAKYQDPAVVSEKKNIERQLAQEREAIREQHQQQATLKASINGYRDTMNQLLDLQKTSIQKGVIFSPESERNLQRVTAFYLNAQQQFQELNASITAHNQTVQQLQSQSKAVNGALELQNRQAEKEYQAQRLKHNWVIAGLQLLVLIPLLAVAVGLLKKYKDTVYRTIFLTFSIAICIKIAFVMHEYFPSYLFKYILIFALIGLTVRVLMNRLRMAVTPNLAWLKKQYQESYQKNQCPMCECPIRPGISKFLAPDAKNNLPIDWGSLQQVDAYTCPGCGELLFESCTQCSHVRYSLFRYCDCCGAEKISEHPPEQASN